MSKYIEDRKELILNDLTSLSDEAISKIQFKEGELYITEETIDTVPTKGSTNMVTSGGVRDYVDGKVVELEKAIDDSRAEYDLLTYGGRTNTTEQGEVITSNIYGQITAGNDTNTMTGTCVGNIDGQALPFKITTSGTKLHLDTDETGTDASDNTIYMYGSDEDGSSGSYTYMNAGFKSTPDDYENTQRYYFGKGTQTLTFQWDLKKSRTATFTSHIFASRLDTFTYTLSGSNNGSTWTTIKSGNVVTNAYYFYDREISCTGTYRYFRMIITNLDLDITHRQSISVYYMYLAAVTPDYREQYSNKFTFSGVEFIDNKKYYFKTPSNVVTDKVTYNTLNGIPLSAILKPSTYYEIIPNGGIFDVISTPTMVMGTYTRGHYEPYGFMEVELGFKPSVVFFVYHNSTSSTVTRVLYKDAVIEGTGGNSNRHDTEGDGLIPTGFRIWCDDGYEVQDYIAFKF